MGRIDLIKLYSAGTSFGLANTSAFLLRRLQDDAAVAAVRSIATDEEILHALKVALSQEPKTLEDRARPFVLLIALSRSPDVTRLDVAQALQPRPEFFDWYFEMLRTLKDSKSPTSYSTVKVPVPSAVLTSSANNIIKKGV